MDPREQRGLVIAATTKLTKKQGLWSVPSQTSNDKRYSVQVFDNGFVHCSCPDFEERQQPCKHIFAVKFTMTRETSTVIEIDNLGNTSVTQTVTETVKASYSQNWTAYNQGQQNEKRLFLPLLRDLCKMIEEPAYEAGRPRLPLSDMVFCAAFKVYSGMSGRRFASDLDDAQDKGFIAKAPHFNSVFNVLELESLTPELEKLVEVSALPLRDIETDFAVDSTGFGTSRHETWHSVKHGGVVSRRDWVKAHICCGVKTNIITAAKVTNHREADCPHLPALVSTTAQSFDMAEVSADKGYSSAFNHFAIDQVGATPYILFRSNTTGTSATVARQEGGALWKKMFRIFQVEREEYLMHYHKRSNVESTFSMVKGKFGESLRSRSEHSRINESLLKLLCHNICVVISSIYELGIDPSFCTKSPMAAQKVAI